MKAPLLQQRVESTPGGVPSQAPGLPRSDAAEAFGQAGAALGRSIDKAVAEGERDKERYEQEKYKASVSLARDELTAYNQETTDTLYGSTSTAPAEIGDQPGNEQAPGFLQTQGRGAAEHSADTLKNLETKRQNRASNIQDPTARNLFLQESASTYAQSHRTVEQHVAQQVKVAQEDSVNLASTEAIAASAKDPINSELARERIAGVVGPMHALAGDRPEYVEQQTLKLQGQVTAQRLNALIERKDVANAQRVLDENRTALGAQGSLPHYEEAVRVMGEKAHADTFALGLINGARGENGFVDVGKAIDALQALPEDKRTPEVEAHFEKWLNLESAKKKTIVEAHFSTGLTSYLERHSLSDIDAGTETWLRQNDPEGWHRLEVMSREHKLNGPPTTGQMAAMTRFMVDVADHPDKYATMPAEEFNREWVPFLSRHDVPRAAELLAHMHGQAQKPEKLSPVEVQALLEMGRKAEVFPEKGNDPSKWDDDQARAFFIAHGQLAERIAQEKRATGKAPDLDKVRAWTKELLLEGKDPDAFSLFGWGGKTTRLQQMVKDEKGEGAGFEPKWDEADRKKAVDYLQKQGARTDDAAVDAVLRKVHKLPALKQDADRNAKEPTELDPGRWGLDLTPPPSIPRTPSAEDLP